MQPAKSAIYCFMNDFLYRRNLKISKKINIEANEYGWCTAEEVGDQHLIYLSDINISCLQDIIDTVILDAASDCSTRCFGLVMGDGGFSELAGACVECRRVGEDTLCGELGGTHEAEKLAVNVGSDLPFLSDKISSFLF